MTEQSGESSAPWIMMSSANTIVVKKKAHTVKNNVIVGCADRHIKYLGDTHSGKKHDKKIADEEQTQLPEGSVILRDLGFKGADMGKGVTVIEPKKKPRNKCLTPQEKEEPLAKLHFQREPSFI
ncbi:MAG: transposase family protein [Candidatus Thiothrix putei]|uniref:Transposase family protein n=1 Tax=Candidatus Thiothrix putei TaxID=3080811 RepID=A0AA95KQC7_9GAMM|nr:MAG: transposase family protein [Candidatus Thiothrix putei]